MDKQIERSPTMSWGSGQYESDCDLYNDLCKLEEEHGQEAVFKKLGLNDDEVLPVDAIDALRSSLKADALEIKDEFINDGVYTLEEFHDKVVQRIDTIKTITDIFHYLRDEAWDLWGAISYIVPVMFPKLASKEPDTGAGCWLLKTFGFVEADEPFQDFDT